MGARRTPVKTYTNIFGEVVVATKRGNPCVGKFGRGPEGLTCRTCAHLSWRQYSRVYYKCKYRGDTHGPATDHRVSWPACAKYEDWNTPPVKEATCR